MAIWNQIIRNQDHNVSDDRHGQSGADYLNQIEEGVAI